MLNTLNNNRAHVLKLGPSGFIRKSSVSAPAIHIRQEKREKREEKKKNKPQTEGNIGKSTAPSICRCWDGMR
jgi:hypothetical protein